MPSKVKPIRDAFKTWKLSRVNEVREKVDWNALNKLNIVNALFKNTEVEDLANYPKRPLIKNF